jgi:hypothetical protein
LCCNIIYTKIYRLSCRVSDETLKQQELEIDELGLETPIKIKGKIIKTFGELRIYATSTRNIRKMGALEKSMIFLI